MTSEFGDPCIMVYLFGWAAMFIVALLQYHKIGGERLFVGVVLSYCTFVAFFRGNVGTDTSTYVTIFENIQNDVYVPPVEVGFTVLAKGILTVLPDIDLAVRFFSLLYFGCLFLYLIRSNRDERFLLLSFVLPVFSYSHSLNVIRIGLASVICLLIVQSIRRSGLIGKGKYFLLSFLMQYSSLLIPLFFYASIADYRNGRFLRYMVAATFFIMTFVLISFNYIEEKIIIYEDSSSPSLYSGALHLVVGCVLTMVLFFGKLPRSDKKKIALWCMFSICAAFIFSRYNYAGLRLLDMLVFIVPVSIVYLYNKNNMRLDRSVKFALFFCGLILSVNAYINYIQEEGQGESPFLPYEFQFLVLDRAAIFYG